MLIKGVYGMVLFDDFVSVQNIINISSEFVEVLKKYGIIDSGKVVIILFIVGFFDGKDGLQQDVCLLKVVSYLDIGDGNYWVYLIENLVVVVDFEVKKIIKIEEGLVILVLMEFCLYDGCDCNVLVVKLLEIIELEGKNYIIIGDIIYWQNWDFYLCFNLCVGLILLMVIYNDNGIKCQVMYEGFFGGMIVFYGDLDVGWYFKVYFDFGDYGMGILMLLIVCGKDVLLNVVLLDEIIVDYIGKLIMISGVVVIFECYVGFEYKYLEMGKFNVSIECWELVVCWISIVGNYDYIFDWVFYDNGIIGIDVGVIGIEVVKGVLVKIMYDFSVKEDICYGMLIDYNIVGIIYQYIYNFCFDFDVDGENNILVVMDFEVKFNIVGGLCISIMQVNQYIIDSEQKVVQKFDLGIICLLSNISKENCMGNLVLYQIIFYVGGMYLVVIGVKFVLDEWIYYCLSFMDKQLWVMCYYLIE